MPDTASRVCWLKALKARIQKPMEKLKETIPEILNNNEVGCVLVRLYFFILAYSASLIIYLYRLIYKHS